ncbi:MAG: nucleoside triphosphate pyrophosphohydrolase, partial [Candidatus Aminicenantales bacterium]
MMKKDFKKTGESFVRLVEIMDTLRGDEGCPWDRKQDERTIADYFLEEVYEAVEALYAQEDKLLAEELGDVMMEVVFLARLAEERGTFTIQDVLDGINHKMVRRHPHVFDEKRRTNPLEVSEAWTKQKLAEKERSGFLEGIPKSSPALLAAFMIGARASACGFDWPGVDGVLKKLHEEVAEVEKAIPSARPEDITQEVGDVLFSAANLSRHLGVNPEV